MYSLPSTSHTRAPCALLTKNGCPPTARNARTGELTPPGMYFKASANNASEFAREITRRKLFLAGAQREKIQVNLTAPKPPQQRSDLTIPLRNRNAAAHPECLA